MLELGIKDQIKVRLNWGEEGNKLSELSLQVFSHFTLLFKY